MSIFDIQTWISWIFFTAKERKIFPFPLFQFCNFIFSFPILLTNLNYRISTVEMRDVWVCVCECVYTCLCVSVCVCVCKEDQHEVVEPFFSLRGYERVSKRTLKLSNNFQGWKSEVITSTMNQPKKVPKNSLQHTR
jgi:hypothetical protein